MSRALILILSLPKKEGRVDGNAKPDPVRQEYITPWLDGQVVSDTLGTPVPITTFLGSNDLYASMLKKNMFAYLFKF